MTMAGQMVKTSVTRCEICSQNSPVGAEFEG